jgi:hypothetical protein
MIVLAAKEHVGKLSSLEFCGILNGNTFYFMDHLFEILLVVGMETCKYMG